MANYDFMVILQGESNLSEDVFVNVLHYDVNFPDTVEGTADELWTKYDTILKPMLASVTQAGHRIKVYEAGPPPRQPVLDKTYAFATGPAGNKAPTEVALCLSYATADNPDQVGARHRGRIYLGPILGDLVTANRPNELTQDIALDFGEGLAQVGDASNTTWVMYSQRDNEYRKIESIWCDNAWDTQRRRGLAPTVRTVRDVQ